MAAQSSSPAVQAIKHIIQSNIASRTFGAFLGKLKIVSCADNVLVCEMKVEKEHLNLNGTLHGGCTTTLIDNLSTYVLMSVPPYQGGVSVDLNVSFLRTARDGDDIVIESRNVKVGKTLAFLEVDIKDKSSGKLIATGKHTKFIGESKSQL